VTSESDAASGDIEASDAAPAHGYRPGWQMRPATHAFTAENAAAQLGAAFASVTCVRPASEAPAVIDHDGAFEVSGDLAAFVCR
jgi:hypothetical protein